MNIDDLLEQSYKELLTIFRHSFPENLKRIQAERKISQEELSADTNIPINSIWAYLSDYTLPNTPYLMKLTVFLNVSIYDLLFPYEFQLIQTSSNIKNREKIYEKLDKIELIVNQMRKEL